MRVLALPADEGGCGFYRVRGPAGSVSCQVEVTSTLTVGRVAGKLRHVPVDADIVVFQRPARPHLVEIMAQLRRQGVAVVVELDDDFTCLHPSNPARDPLATACLDAAAKVADLVTVTTPALAERYAPHGRYAVLPNYVPEAYLSIASGHDGVGWSGSIDTHPDDLQVTRGAVGRTVDRFHVVGTGKGVKDALGLTVEPTATGWVPLVDYPQELARLAVGIVPLADTAFNRAKSALKMLEMASVGVVPVVSPTPDNLRLHADGIGLVAHRPRDWQRHIRALQDPALLAEMSQAGREAAGRHTIEKHGWRWDEAWAHALGNRRAA